ncbi:hypothetical protein K402DRAFT_426099 [Aulographum hederae CBS 113979]|uniref:Fungal-type protein kinase domain-containing protein n=1 Tax=Aulographum hederae CBS 113979 TaxID=1176131 RepID=A0A6G1GI33_9PEZI|nr:hypothetical protein K402DRAFT_426099 [Aulographum hederae CBS 113979]
MSLLVTPTLTLLYSLANRDGAQEHESVTFWSHYLSKQVFADEHWIVAHEKPPSEAKENRRRRVDFNLCVAKISDNRLDVCAFVEGKGAKTKPREIEMVEAQVQQACEAGSRATTTWAIAFHGTSARVFECNLPEFAYRTDYIDANSPEASRLTRYFEYMRDSFLMQHEASLSAPSGMAALGETSSGLSGYGYSSYGPAGYGKTPSGPSGYGVADYGAASAASGHDMSGYGATPSASSNLRTTG